MHSQSLNLRLEMIMYVALQRTNLLGDNSNRMVTLCETNHCNTVHRKINDGNSVCQLALLASIAPLLLNTVDYLLVFNQ